MFTIFWFRRDLRFHDNRGLWECLKKNHNTLFLFIFDTNILGELPENDRRVNLIYDTLMDRKRDLETNYNSSFLITYGKPEEIHRTLLKYLPVLALYFNHDYEPYPLARDEKVRLIYRELHKEVFSFKDHVVFEAGEILNPQNEPFKVYSQYKKQWFLKFRNEDMQEYPSDKFLFQALQKETIAENSELFFKLFQELPRIYESYESLEHGRFPDPVLEKIGFKKTKYFLPALQLEREHLIHYEEKRNFPYLEEGTSKASVYLRFGLKSVRELLRSTYTVSKKYVEELVWREFYIMILYHFPDSVEVEWNPRYRYLRSMWRNPEKEEDAMRDFEKWAAGETGYPLVDAGMKELRETGYQHNRVRMVCANFLVKDLRIDWKFGERYYAKLLMDFELASNVGNWQWCSGTGVDAAPYFRIFNPELQQKKFDPDFVYIKKWLPGFKEENTYLPKMVEHEEAKKIILEWFEKKS